MTTTGTHPCLCGCGTHLSRTRIVCPAGWRHLPTRLAEQVTATRTARCRNPQDEATHAAYRAATHAALDWYRRRAEQEASR